MLKRKIAFLLVVCTLLLTLFSTTGCFLFNKDNAPDGGNGEQGGVTGDFSYVTYDSDTYDEYSYNKNLYYLNELNFQIADPTVIYVEEGASVDKWDIRWNSSYAPVFTGCTISEDGKYIESFVKSDLNPDNLPTDGKMSLPIKEGYTFVGFSATSGSKTAEYTLNSINEAPNGKRLYTVWDEE